MSKGGSGGQQYPTGYMQQPAMNQTQQNARNAAQFQLGYMPSYSRGQPGPMGASGSYGNANPFGIPSPGPMYPGGNVNPPNLRRPQTGYGMSQPPPSMPQPMGQTQMPGTNTYSAPTTDQVTDAYGNVMPQKVSDPYMTAGGNQTGGRSPMDGMNQPRGVVGNDNMSYQQQMAEMERLRQQGSPGAAGYWQQPSQNLTGGMDPYSQMNGLQGMTKPMRYNDEFNPMGGGYSAGGFPMQNPVNLRQQFPTQNQAADPMAAQRAAMLQNSNNVAAWGMPGGYNTGMFGR